MFAPVHQLWLCSKFHYTDRTTGPKAAPSNSPPNPLYFMTFLTNLRFNGFNSFNGFNGLTDLTVLARFWR